MLIYSPLSAYFDDVISQQPTLSNDGKPRQPALGDFTSPIGFYEGDSLLPHRLALGMLCNPVGVAILKQ
jgi:hypothetical protein